MRIGLIVLIVAGLTLAGCLKSEEFPPEPSLTFVGFETYEGDSAVAEFDFVDGDGNFGLSQGDTTGVFAECINRFNMFFEYYEFQDGAWVHVPLNPCAIPEQVAFYYRVPFAEPTGQIKTQKGRIRVTLKPTYYLNSEFEKCRFEVSIKDRSLNQSNVVRTSVFEKP